MTKPCTQCGNCCRKAQFMGSLSATREDVERWRKEKREDILKWVQVVGLPSSYADLWVDSRGHERHVCPFVRKNNDGKTYRCSIYETRPQECRDYVPFSGKPNDVCVEVP